MKTKSELLNQIFSIINSESSIKNHIDKVAEIREELYPMLNDDEIINIANQIKDKVQVEAGIAIKRSKGWGTILMATGTGKSKIVVDRIKPGSNNYIIVPTEKLRDNGWKEEFVKWGKLYLFERDIKIICYASLHVVLGQEIDEVYLDEGHNLTEAKAEPFFKNNTIHSCVLLTATEPTSTEKKELLKKYKLYTSYEITIDEAVKLGLVSPYELIIIQTQLDNTEKYIVGGSKKKPFLQTEQQAYGYSKQIVKEAPSKHLFLKRMHFIYNIKSKTNAAKWILNNVIPKDLKTLIFCGSKDQANQLCEHRFYSRPSKKKGKNYDEEEYRKLLEQWHGNTDLEMFINDLIKRMACVDALNEGQNIPGLDCGLMPQIDSTSLAIVQRTGRIIRFRPNHIGKIIILTVKGTVDEEWTMNAIKDLNPISINTIEFSRLTMGIETILF